MAPLLSSFADRIEARLLPAIETAEERRRRLFLAATLLLVIPPAGYFALTDLRRGLVAEAVPVLGLVALLLLQLLILNRPKGLWWLFRGTLLLCIAALSREMALGTSHGLAFLWLYPLPLIFFFLFGVREGGRWAMVCVLSTSLLFLGEPLAYDYPLPIVIRFEITFLLVLTLAYRMERSRQRSELEMVREKSALEAALLQVNHLSGLLPICASCKNVRDDQGYWRRIESYVAQNSEAELHPSLCPDCRLGRP